MKPFIPGVIGAMCLVVSACAPSTILIPDGNGFIELTQTRHIWESNAVSVGHCESPEFSKCPKGTPKQVYVMTGPGPGMAGAGIQAAGMLGGAAIVRDGLIKGKPKVNNSNSNTTNEHFSTKYVGK
jgi:hypothetical protein